MVCIDVLCLKTWRWFDSATDDDIGLGVVTIDLHALSVVISLTNRNPYVIIMQLLRRSASADHL